MTTGQHDDATEGREAVRVHFVQRLRDAGVERPKGMTEASYADMMKGLVEWLAYMRVDNLITLAELVLNATPAWKGKCPSELYIRQTANNLQGKPPAENRIFTSWLASVEGPTALAGGYLVELFRFLRARGVPPSAYDMRKIHEEADANQRTRILIEGRISRDTATPEDRQWMAAWAADKRMANDIVRTGAERRAARQEGMTA
ncbi:hypothetical protein [Falsirhodobacter halotolerans]|uniref:hypothetical protein n=1 Tax=Falsirhodobacter halotolerans TaxID=1146892 RepID=UPI001FD2FD58|nr:hypothetical protein [Falsirhodobacter halotolerans]MCJ8139501.1 hypothetical protein [Falsirhodobacter halotolerans]